MLKQYVASPVYKKHLQSKYNLHKHKDYPTGVFAFIYRRPRLGFFRVTSNKDWAVRTEVDNTADDEKPDFLFSGGRTSMYWHVKKLAMNVTK